MNSHPLDADPPNFYRALTIVQGNTTWIRGRRETRPLQLSLPLPMEIDYPSREAIAAQCSGKHLVRMVCAPGQPTHYVIDKGDYAIRE